MHKSSNSYVVEVAEISATVGAKKIEPETSAVNCGVAANPDITRARIEGSIGYDLGAVMRNQITLTAGELNQTNFPDYEPLRISDMPEIDVHIVPVGEAPTGVGQPDVPPIGPAVANAIFAATGTRITDLPIAENGMGFA